jgi:hypothetical protein
VIKPVSANSAKCLWGVIIAGREWEGKGKFLTDSGLKIRIADVSICAEKIDKRIDIVLARREQLCSD